MERKSDVDITHPFGVDDDASSGWDTFLLVTADAPVRNYVLLKEFPAAEYGVLYTSSYIGGKVRVLIDPRYNAHSVRSHLLNHLLEYDQTHKS